MTAPTSAGQSSPCPAVAGWGAQTLAHTRLYLTVLGRVPGGGWAFSEHTRGARCLCTRVLCHQRPHYGIMGSGPLGALGVPGIFIQPRDHVDCSLALPLPRWVLQSLACGGHAVTAGHPGSQPPPTHPLPFPLAHPPRPLLRGPLLRHRTAALGLAGCRRAPAWLLGPEPQLPVVPSGRAARPVPVSHAAPPAARRVEAASW